MKSIKNKYYNGILWLSTTLLLQKQAMATPTEGFPLDEQLPNVARVGESYSFTMNEETYTSDSDITYSADNLPSWLSFDSSSLTFSGTPETSDVTDGLEFQLIGKDSTGSLNNTYTFVVSSNPGPEVTDNIIDEQLSTMGLTDGNSGLVISPNTEFNIKFNSSTFELRSGSSSSSEIVDYYGRFANRTSLPAWCTFNADDLSFSGTAPTINSNIAPSQKFELMLIATDYEGYTGAFANFQIVVGGHELATNLTAPVIVNGTAGDPFTVDIPLDQVFLDGYPINQTDIKSIELYQGPSWASVSDDTVEGSVPDDQSINQLLNVTITDNYGDSVFINFEIDIFTEIFTVSSFDDVNATRGEFFEYTLDENDFSNLDNTTISVSFDDNSWLTYYYTNYTLAGTVPDDFDSVDVTVEGSMNSISDERDFKIRGVSFDVSSSSASSSSSSSASSSSSTASTTTSTTSSSSSATASATSTAVAHKKDNTKALAIGLGVGIPCFIILVAAILLLCCIKRRKNKKDDDDEKSIGGSPLGKKGSNDTISFSDGKDSKGLSEFNLLKLDNKDNMSHSSSMTNVDTSQDSIYHDAMFQQSSDMLLPSQQPPQVTKSWRKSTWKPRDSLTSLATVATNDLLTVKVVDDPLIQRKSQLNLLHPALPEEDSDFDATHSSLDPAAKKNYSIPSAPSSSDQIRSLAATDSFHTAANSTSNQLVSNSNSMPSVSALSVSTNQALKTPARATSNNSGDFIFTNNSSSPSLHNKSPLIPTTTQPVLRSNNPFITTPSTPSKKSSDNTLTPKGAPAIATNSNSDRPTSHHQNGPSETSLSSDLSSSSLDPKLGNVNANLGQITIVRKSEDHDAELNNDGGEKSIQGVIVNGSSSSIESFDDSQDKYKQGGYL